MALLLLACVAPAAAGQLSTEDHLTDPGFWPTKGQASMAEFAGEAACGRCHAAIATTQRATSMARTAMPAASAEILHRQPDLHFQYGDDKYRIQGTAVDGRWQSQFSVDDGGESLGFPLLWAFGTGRVGQSFLFKKEDGHFYEARVTYFKALHGIDFTPARALSGPTGLEQAMGRPVEQAELIRCFSCHATGVTIADSFNEKALVPGVTCEACHGPGAKHVALMETAAKARTTHPGEMGVMNPTHLSPTESVEFCGACHGSWWDVKLAHVTGPSTVRSAPYRLVTSKCWGKGEDDRLTCTACHDPHKELRTEATAYDAACLRCHASAATAGVAHADAVARTGARQKACPVATAKCTSCHMPKVYVPEMHDTFTDHRIRVVQKDEAFRD